MIDKNLFLYDLAIVAIFKNEGHYLKEWLDYHLQAGVEHFYLYNNDSTDNYKEVLAPYVESNLVTLIDFPGKVMQLLAYNDAIEKFCFECRYIAFIDIDEFIFPKSNRPIIEVVDEILSHDSNASGLAINWQIFGSNGQEKADYSRGVLERFTRRAARDAVFIDANGKRAGHVKIVVNPRFIRFMNSPHSAYYFSGKFDANSNGELIPGFYNDPVLDDRIVVNHYCVKSREEFKIKNARGRSDTRNKWPMEYFNDYDRNEVFDNSILKYRAAREKIFSFESDNARINRVINALFQTLTQSLSEVSFVGKLETFLTCQAVAEKLQIKIGEHLAEEIALTLIYRTLRELKTRTEVEMFLKTLPKILSRPFPICKQIYNFVQSTVLPRLCNTLKKDLDYEKRSNWLYIQQLLNLIKL